MTLADRVKVRRVRTAEARRRADDLLRVYAAAFAGPPWQMTDASAQAHRARLLEDLEHDDAEVVFAEEDDELLGAAYGWPAPDRLPDRDLYRRVAEAAGERLVAERLTGGVLELVELMVDPSAQRRGLGRLLLDTIRAGRAAWLLTHPEGAAVDLYARTGWSVESTLTTNTGIPLLLCLHDAKDSDWSPHGATLQPRRRI